jgi:CRISPR-associated protein Cas1
LAEAWRRVHRNAGAAGADGVSVETFAATAAIRLKALHDGLRAGDYRPGPVRRVEIPKPGGGVRPLDIPCVVDRVAQGAVALTLLGPLDAEMEEASFAYRPGRSVRQAVERIDLLRRQGFTQVVDADIERYFEAVPHDRLVDRLVASIGEGPLTELIALWLEAALPLGRGLPQGSPLSPLLSNLYLDAVDEALAGRGVRLVRFADDFVVLCKSRDLAETTLERAARLLADQGLALNRDKTRLVDFDQGFRFLGHLFVRSLVVKSVTPGTAAPPAGPLADEGEALLRLVAAQDADRDRADAAARSAAEADRRAGFDRALSVLYLREPGRRLSVRNRAFTVEEAETPADRAVPEAAAGWREILALPHQGVDRIEVGPAATVTEAARRHALDSDTPIAWVDGHGRTLGLLAAPSATGDAALQLAQARHALDPDLRVELARRLVEGRIRNQRALLHRLNRQRRDAPTMTALVALQRELRKLPRAADVPALMGHEGAAAALYWPAFGRMLEGDLSFDRRRRPPPDPVNAVLSYLAGLLARDVEALMRRHGLHPGFGVLHTAQGGGAARGGAPGGTGRTGGGRTGGGAAVWDLMEEFRAPLVEGLAVYLINQRMLGDADIRRTGDCDGSCRLGGAAVATVIRQYERWLDRPIRSPRSGRRILWRRLIEEQAVALADHLRGGEPYRPYRMDY